MEIPFKGTYQKEDILHAVQMTAKESTTWKIIRYILVLVLVANMALTINQIISADRPAADWVMVLPSLVIAIYIVFQPAITAWMITSRLWKRLADHADIQGTISSTGLTMSQLGTDKEITWDTYGKVEVSDQYAVLLAPGGYMNIFTSRFFQNELDWKEFIQIARGKIVPKNLRG